MRVKKFEGKVRKEMFRFLTLTLFIMLVLTLILFGFYGINIRRVRLERAAENYSDYLNTMIHEHETDYYEENIELFSDFFSGEAERNQVFSTFYRFNSNQYLNSDFFLLDENSDMVLSTNTLLEEDNSFLHYVNIVISNERETKEPITRVYRALNGEQYLLMFNPIIEQNDILGFGISSVNGNEILSLEIDSSVNYVIYDQYENIFSTNASQIIQTSRGKVDLNILRESNGFVFEQYDTIEQSFSNNLHILTFQEIDNYLTVLYRSIIGIVIIIIIVMVQSFYFSKKVSKKIGSSLIIINQELEKVKNDSDYLLNVQTGDEFDAVAEQVNKMLIQLKNINNKNMKLSRLNLDAQKKRLDAQFNPHFLANTLEAVQATMYIDPNIASELILKMNKILRYSIDDEYSEITLGEDIEYLKDYLKINCIRLEEFEYKIELDSQLELTIIPKLFLLPLIENSLKYGYKKRRDLMVVIKILKTEKGIRIRVMDNGGGLSKKDTHRINKTLQDPSNIINHHGLKNTKQRIELFYPYTTFHMYTKLGWTIVEMNIDGGKYV